MSVQAMSWVMSHSKARLGDRLVLLAVANYARQDGSAAWPSMPTLAADANMSERQVRRCIRNLEAMGELATSVNTGPLGCNVYCVPGMMPTELPEQPDPDKLTPGQIDPRTILPPDKSDRNVPEMSPRTNPPPRTNPTAPPDISDRTPDKSDRNVSEMSGEPLEPLEPLRTIKEPKERAARERAPNRPDGVNENIWRDWLALRKAKKAPVTDTVLAAASSEASKAGMSLGDFLAEWCLRGSQGLKADWLIDRVRSSRQLSAVERVEANIRARCEREGRDALQIAHQ